jgi:hypothetical protein
LIPAGNFSWELPQCVHTCLAQAQFFSDLIKKATKYETWRGIAAAELPESVERSVPIVLTFQ